MTKVLKDIYIEAGQLDRFFEGVVPVDLYRAKRREGRSAFDFVEEAFVLSNGRPRPADITIRLVGDVKWVFIQDRPRGISTFDKSGVPPGKAWEYYLIPAGAELPEGLAITKDEYNNHFGATHYTIAPAHDMPLERFKFLLSVFSRSLVREAI